MKDIKNTIKSYLCMVFFFIFFVVGVLSSFLYSTAFDSDKYIKKMEKNGYDAVVLDSVHKKLEDMGDVISLSEDDIYNLLDKESITQYSKEYVKKYLDALFNGKEFNDETAAKYSLEYAKDGIRSLVENFYEKEKNDFSEEEFIIIYDYIENQINSSLRFLSKSILEDTLPLGKYISLVKKVFQGGRWAFIPAAILLFVIVLLNFEKGIGKVLYRTGSTVFIPSALLFIPAWLFSGYNLGERIVLGRSPLSVIVTSVLDTVIKGFEFISGIFFVISLILILTGSALVVFYKKGKSDEVTEKAFGKINLCLDIVSRRSNGYHNIESVMHTIPLYDTITVKKSKKGITVTCTNPNVPTDSSNLVYKAALLFFEKTKINGGVEIHIDKKLPMAAGMAGGSSDGAATLRALNRLYSTSLSTKELESMGASLGADVPFCIRGGTEGVVSIGYDFIKVSAPPKFIYVIACGSEGISTPEMYKEYDNLYSPPTDDNPELKFTKQSEKLRLALEKGDKKEIFESMFNGFESIAEEKRPIIKEIKKIMNDSGAYVSMMSGSGPSVFGIFETKEDADKAKDLLICKGITSFVVAE